MTPQFPSDLPALGIRRPFLILVLNLLIVLAGIAALFGVEVRELPDVDRPIVSVYATYPGASPETMDAEVTSILERGIARVSGVKQIRSASEENNGRLRAEFSPGVSLESAAADVREAVSRVQRELPETLEELVVIKADEDAEPIVRLAAMTDRLSEDALTQVIEHDIVPVLLAIDGVADVQLDGARQRLLRVVLDPVRLTSYGLSVTDVASVLRNAPLDVPAGSFRSRDQELLVRADASAVTAREVEDIVLRDTVRIGDVAQVFFGPADPVSFVQLDGRRVLSLGVVRQAQSNTIEISNAVRRAVTRLNDRLDDVELAVISDNATFIRGSVREVVTTLALTISIVVATIWVFLGTLRATLVPSVVIPIALIGTLGAIWLFGFTINILTLLALVLATGLIVDDAIVVVENIQRRRMQGLGSRVAAVLGARQVFFAIVATTAVLVSVFVPISFLPSTAGRLFREFGFILSTAVIISSFVALSLVPTLAARIPNESASPGLLRRTALEAGRILALGYERVLTVVLRHPGLALLTALVLAGAAASLFSDLDEELLPPEDRGVFYVSAQGPDGVGLGYMERQAEQMEAVLRPVMARGEIASLFTVVGRWDPNRAFITAPLTPWEARSRSQQEILDEVREPLSQIPGSRISLWSPNSLNLRGAGGGIEVALLGNDYDQIYEAARTFSHAIEDRLAHVSEPRIAYQPTQPQLSVQIDRRRAADLGVSLEGLAATLRVMIDGDELVDLNVADEAVPIMLEASTGAINDPSDLVNLYVSTRNGGLVPLSSIVSLTEEGVAAQLDRHAQRRAIEIDANLSPGYPLRSAVEDLEGIADAVLPPGVSLLLLGEAATLEETSREVALTFAIALLVVFLVLVAQFESLTSAAVVMVTVPFGIASAVFALFITGTSLNIYSQIGLIMLIGLMAKNGILLVEFADQLREAGYSVHDAVATAAKVRLRPITMTMVSTILGGLPLVLSGGPGAEARHAIGWIVLGGLGLAAAFTLFLTPVAYRLVAPFSKPRTHEAARLGREFEEAESIPDDADHSPA